MKESLLYYICTGMERISDFVLDRVEDLYHILCKVAKLIGLGLIISITTVTILVALALLIRFIKYIWYLP